MNWLFELHRSQPVAHALGVIFAVCVLGMGFGSIRFRGLGLGTSGVLFAGIIVGHFGEFTRLVCVRISPVFTCAGPGSGERA